MMFYNELDSYQIRKTDGRDHLMSMKVNGELDFLFETLGLLYHNYHFDKIKSDLMKDFAEFGINGEVFYQQHLKILDKYILTFKKNRKVSSADNFYFGDYDTKFFLFYCDTLIRNRNYLAMEWESDHSIKTEMLKSLQAVYDYDTSGIDIDNLESIIQFLEQSKLNENTKWKIMQFFYQPKERFQTLADLVNANIEPYKKALNAISKPLSALLNDYQNSYNGESSFNLLKSVENTSNIIAVCPTLIFPVAQLSLGEYFYYGLLSSIAFEKTNSHANSTESILLKLKAISDNSKLQILLSLKDSPKYNLEIAEQLGLTAATMSHHMNVLLTCGLVGVTKKHGRVYYHIDIENIGKFIINLQELLL